MTARKNILRVLRFLLFIGIGLGVVWIFWSSMSDEDKEICIQSLRDANYLWIGAAIVLGALSHISRALRWRLIIEPFGYKPRVPNLFFAVMVMYFINMAVTRLGEISRCVVLQRYEKIPFEKSFGTVVAERAVDLLCLLLLFGVTAIFQAGNLQVIFDDFIAEVNKEGLAGEEPGFFMKNLKWFVLGFFVSMFLLFYFLRKHPFFGKIYRKAIDLLKGFLAGLRSVTKVRRPWEFIFHTVFIWTMYFLMTYVCFFCLPETSTYNLLVPLTVLVFGSVAIAALPGGIGAYPIFVAVIFRLYDVSYGTGYALGWIIWASQVMLVLLLGIISVVLLPLYNNRRDA